MLHILFWLLAIVPAALLVLLWDRLPGTIPLHWNAAGTIDRWGSPAELVILAILPIVFAVAFAFGAHAQRHRANLLYALGCLPSASFTILLGGMLLPAASGAPARTGGFVSIPTPTGTLNAVNLLFALIGATWICLGGYALATRSLRFFNLGLPWAVLDREKHDKLARFYGWAFTVCGIISILAALTIPASTAVNDVVLLVVICTLSLLAVGVSAWYAYHLR